MQYKIGEMASLIGIAPSTLRYYDKEGLLPFVKRTQSGVRIFQDVDYEWLWIIECLKKTGMPLCDIKHFIQLSMIGDETIEKRLNMIVKQKEEVMKQIEELNENLNTLEYKEWYYQKAKSLNSTQALQNMKIDEFPKEFHQTVKKLKGK